MWINSSGVRQNGQNEFSIVTDCFRKELEGGRIVLKDFCQKIQIKLQRLLDGLECLIVSFDGLENEVWVTP